MANNNLNYEIIKKFDSYYESNGRDMSLAAHVWFLDWLCEKHPTNWEVYVYNPNVHKAFFDEIFGDDLITFTYLPKEFCRAIMAANYGE